MIRLVDLLKLNELTNKMLRPSSIDRVNKDYKDYLLNPSSWNTGENSWDTFNFGFLGMYDISTGYVRWARRLALFL